MTIVEKIGVSDDPDAETPDWEPHNEGAANPGKSIPVEYTARGTLDSEIEKGRSIVLFRSERNGTRAAGILTTSAVQSVEDHGDFVIAETRNSIYKVTPHDDS
jgi:hypothetical protein